MASASQAIEAAAGDVVLTWAEKHQTMTGFGAAAVFWAPNITDQQAEFFFSQPKGLGLSLLRISAKSYQDGTNSTVATYSPELETAKKAHALGAQVWASSWTPPPAWKTNGGANAKPGARLQASHYADFADGLANFAASMAAAAVPLWGISPQNEPDYESDWEGCLWSPQEMTTFVRDHLGPKLAAKSPVTRVIAPDTAGWGAMPGYADALMADNTAKGYVGAIATHPYGGGNLAYTVPANNNKEFWETEVSQEHAPVDTPDPTMTSAITMLRMMHDHLTVANMNAWHWWALINTDNPIADQMRQNPALIQAGVTFKRAYALGNFAKFVRPGMVRIGATASPATDILVSAYRDDTRLSIVAVNASAQARNQKFLLDGAQFGQVVPWVTSEALSLAKQSPISATDNFSYSLPAKSAVTFVNWIADSESPPDGGGGAGGSGGTSQQGGTGGLGGLSASGGSAAGGAPDAATSGAGGSIAIGGSQPTSAGTFGVAGGGGVPASGGGATAAGSGGMVVSTGTAPQGTTAGDPGCGCHIPNSERRPGAGAWLTLLGIAVAWRRRSRRRPAQPSPDLPSGEPAR